MKAPPNNSSPNHRSPSNTPRREKRRHFPIPDPLGLIHLAVQLDERNEDFLKVPLEKGRLYLDEFEDVVELLSKPVRFPTKALTPIVLSGLLVRQQGARNAKAMATDLVKYVRVLRYDARQRWKRRKKHQRVRIIFIVVLSVLLCGAYLYNCLSSLYTNVSDWGFMGVPNFILPCHQLPWADERHTCLNGDAHIWTAVRENAILSYKVLDLFANTENRARISGLFEDELNRIMDNSLVPRSGDRYMAFKQDSSAPFAIHTKVTKGVRKSTISSAPTPTTTPSPTDVAALAPKQTLSQAETIIRWLGDSRLAQLIRPQIGHKRVAILDIECGLGSLLYALSPQGRNYTCLTTSPASAYLALLLIRDLQMKRRHKSVQFLQMGLHRYLATYPNDEYDVIVGVDALSYQMVDNDVQRTINLLSNRLKPNGRLVLVDDVLGPHSFPMPKKPGEKEDTSSAATKREVIPHYNWTNIFRRSSMDLVVQRDLGLEFRLPDLEKYDDDKHYDEDGTPIFQRVVGAYARSQQLKEAVMDYFLQPLTVFSPVLQRLLTLYRNVLKRQRKEYHRALGHQNGMIIYVMYVATKLPQQQQQCGSNNNVVRQQQQCQPQQCQPQQCTPQQHAQQCVPA